MIDSFPYDAWDQVTTEPFQAAFWTFGPVNGHAGGGSLTGTYVLTALGILLMVVALVWWVWLEHQKLTEQAERLRAGGM
jgi:hypothetical protein